MLRLVAWLTVNDVTTGSSVPYPEVQPLDLELSPEDAFDLALATARETRGWRSVAESAQGGWFDAEATSTLLRFVDDIRVWVEAPSASGCRIQMRSRSRLGRGDFGANAHRIQAFLRRVGKRVESS